MDIDKKFFKDHPEKNYYVRFYVSGEMYPIFHDCVYMKVVNIGSGVRARMPVL